MHPKLKFIALVMVLAFIALIGIIQYAQHHPITEAEITARYNH